MENISLKQWIIAGIKSGIIIGILVFIVIVPIFIPTGEIGPVMFSHLIFACLNYLFLGIIIGIVLYLIGNKLQNRKLFKCLLASIGIVVGSLFLWMIITYFLFPAFLSNSLLGYCSPYFIYLLLTEVISSWIDSSSSIFFLFLFPFFIGTAFGFLINYFINRIERKMRKNTGQT